MRGTGGPVEQWTVKELVKRDGPFCKLCGKPLDMNLKVPNRAAVTIDHIVPLAKGGLHVGKNLQLAHLRCNSKKGARFSGGRVLKFKGESNDNLSKAILAESKKDTGLLALDGQPNQS